MPVEASMNPFFDMIKIYFVFLDGNQKITCFGSEGQASVFFFFPELFCLNARGRNVFPVIFFQRRAKRDERA